MRLINASTVDLEEKTLKLEQFRPDNAPEYAILSHTWGTKEISLSDLQTGAARGEEFTAAWEKIKLSRDQALEDGLRWIWVDTCCIDKTSSAELSEAINSMFVWYQNAEVCYAYLSDVPANNRSKFASSRWFTRGWTFQELLSPRRVRFFSKEWINLGDRRDLLDSLAAITTIPKSILEVPHSKLPLALGEEYRAGGVGIAQIMSWASRRKTTRPEDMAYCLMGVFNVNMPLLYGEGGVKAFVRLQEEIIKKSDDTSIFAWVDSTHFARDFDTPEEGRYRVHGLIAASIECFASSGDILPDFLSDRPPLLEPPYWMTNKGLRIDLPLQLDSKSGLYFATLGCMRPYKGSYWTVGLYLIEEKAGSGQFNRVKAGSLPVSHDTKSSKIAASNAKKRRTIYVRQAYVGWRPIY